jgi:hypothetical protein
MSMINRQLKVKHSTHARRTASQHIRDRMFLRSTPARAADYICTCSSRFRSGYRSDDYLDVSGIPNDDADLLSSTALPSHLLISLRLSLSISGYTWWCWLNVHWLHRTRLDHGLGIGAPGGVTMNSSRLKRAYDMMPTNSSIALADDTSMAAKKFLCDQQPVRDFAARTETVRLRRTHQIALLRCRRPTLLAVTSMTPIHCSTWACSLRTFRQTGM